MKTYYVNKDLVNDPKFKRDMVEKFIKELRSTPEEIHVKGVLAKMQNGNVCYCAGGIALRVAGYKPGEDGHFDLDNGWINTTFNAGIPTGEIFAYQGYNHKVWFSVATLNDSQKLTFNQIADVYQAILDGKDGVTV